MTTTIAFRGAEPFAPEHGEALCQQALANLQTGERLSFAQGVALYRHADLLDLAQAADRVRQRLHPDGVVTYLIDRNINYTNICVTLCKFCAFYRKPGHEEGYVLTKEAIGDKVAETVAIGGTRILLQGGHNPKLPFSYYTELLGYLHERYPIHVDGFSPSEIFQFSRFYKRPTIDILRDLQAAGLNGLPGGGGEILDNDVRRVVSPFKNGWEPWINIMDAAQALGLVTSATMVMGFGETIEHRVQHVLRLRDQQDRHPENGFTAFIHWTFQDDNTELKADETSALDYLRMLAVARCLLDNIPNVQASWPTQGEKVAQIALRFGANDFGSTMMEENVVSAAGGASMAEILNERQIVTSIRQAGFRPAQRDSFYHIVRHPE